MEEDTAVSSDLECAVTLSISKAPWAILPVMASFQIKLFSRNSPFRGQFTYLTRCNVSGAVEEATSNSIKSIQMTVKPAFRKNSDLISLLILDHRTFLTNHLNCKCHASKISVKAQENDIITTLMKENTHFKITQ